MEYEDLPEGSSTASHMIAGSCAGILEHSITYPVDCVKTRLQCLRPPGAQPHFTLINGLRQLFFEEGFRRSFRGIGAVVFGAGPAHALYFGIYEYMKSILVSQAHPDSNYNHFAHAISGSCATIAHDAIMTPADAVKQRIQLFDSPYHTTWECIRKVCRNEGLGALYRAYFTQLSTNVPFQCVHFVTYEFLQKKLNPSKEYYPWTHIVSGGLAGSAAAALTTPMDVCKTVLNTHACTKQLYSNNGTGESSSSNTLMNVSNESSAHSTSRPIIRGFFGAARMVLKIQGIRGLFMGINARIVATLPGTAISWSVYEYFKWKLSSATNESLGSSTLTSTESVGFQGEHEG